MTPLLEERAVSPTAAAANAVSRQTGAALIVLFLALFLTGATVVLAALNNRSLQLDRRLNLQREMQDVREKLLAYAAMFPENYSASTPNNGPGRLPCPDTDNDGDDDCTGTGLGRLPQYIDQPSGGMLGLSTLGVGTDQQFWYAVHPNFWRSVTATAVNSATATTFTIDGGAADVVALLIAPGEILSGQTRQNALAANYLEGGNADVPTFFSVNNAAPATFNDLVLPIRRAELMTLVTARVAQQMKARLDVYHPANGDTYPDIPAFGAAMAGASAWLADDSWPAVTTYARVDANNATVTFQNCGITYTTTFGSAGLTRSQAAC